MDGGVPLLGQIGEDHGQLGVHRQLPAGHPDIDTFGAREHAPAIRGGSHD